MAAEAPVKARPEREVNTKPILTTRNVTLVSYRLDETTSSEDTQAAILTDLYTRFMNTPGFESYKGINEALDKGRITAGTFVILKDKQTESNVIVVAKYRAV
jgi:hypothetical protein